MVFLSFSSFEKLTNLVEQQSKALKDSSRAYEAWLGQFLLAFQTCFLAVCDSLQKSAFDWRWKAKCGRTFGFGNIDWYKHSRNTIVQKIKEKYSALRKFLS